MRSSRNYYDVGQADVNVLIEAVHEGSTVRISTTDLENIIEQAVAAGTAKALADTPADERPKRPTVDIVIRAVHGGANVVIGR